MRAAVLSLFAAGALAAPSLQKHQHRHVKRQAVDVVYTTCVETEYVTAWAGGKPTAVPASGYAPQSVSNAPAQDGEAEGDGPVQGGSYASAAGAGNNAQGNLNQAPSSQLSASTSAVVADDASVPSLQSYAPPSTPTPPSSFLAASTGVTAAADASESTAPSSYVASSSTSATAPSSTSTTGSTAPGSLPFKNIVIFGDNLSDRGNGSSDHHMAGDPESIYNYNTWTDGLIAAEDLADNMSLPILYDFATGHAAGGSLFGATVDNTFTQSMAMAPSAADQIANYTSGPYYDKSNVGDTLHFLWIGNNDVIPWNDTTSYHPDPSGGAGGRNAQFSSDLANLITKQAKTLTDAGAKYLFVPDVYNRHVAPLTKRYFSNDTDWIANYGQIIQNVNSNLKTGLQALEQTSGATITYYPAFEFMMTTWNASVADDANNINMTTNGDDFCDHSPINPELGIQSLNYCNQGHGYDYFWMQYLDPTAHVHALLAGDMQKAIQAAYP